MTEENKEGSNEENCPLTPSDWVMFLSGEINAQNSMYGTILAVMIAITALCVASLLVVPDARILFIMLVVAFIPMTGWLGLILQKTKKFKKIRNDIIYEELTGYNEIRKQCEKAGVF